MKKNQPWNLSPSQWSNVLETQSGVEKIAREIQGKKMLPWVQTLLSQTSGGETVLDLGSGAGQNSAILALNGRKTTLMDFSQENLDFTYQLFEALGIEGEFIRADMTQPLPFENNSFDTVFSCGVFEYFSDAQIVEILKETFRVAKKRVIIMVPNAASTAYRLGMWYKHLLKEWQWGGERPFLSLKPYMKKAGSYDVIEFSVGARHSLKFLTMPLGNVIRKFIIACLRLKDHAQPAFLNQGYLLVTIAQKKGSGGTQWDKPYQKSQKQWNRKC